MNFVILLTVFVTTFFSSCGSVPAGASENQIFQTEEGQSRFRVETRSRPP